MRPAQDLARDAWESFLLYLPLICLGLLALVTYWMVRSAPSNSTPTLRPLVQHAPDYFMEGFAVKTYDPSGRLRSEVTGTHARHFPDTQWLEIDGIRIRSIDEKGRVTTASANHGLTNEDGSQVQLLGNAVVIRDGNTTQANGTSAVPMEYRSDFLHAFLTTEQLKSNKPVEITHGQDRFTADSMDYDNVEQVLRLDGRVHGTISPAAPPARNRQ